MTPVGPFTAILPFLILFAPVVPLILSWVCLNRGNALSGRTFALLAGLLSLLPAAVGAADCLERTSFDALVSMLFDSGEIMRLASSPPDWFLWMGAGTITSSLAWMTLRSIDAGAPREKGKYLAGARVRGGTRFRPPAVPLRRARARSSGASPAPRG